LPITLDAGTASSGIVYEDDGTEMLRVHNSSSDVIVESKVSDKDIIFKVNDGGSGTEVARFDGDVSAFLLASGKKFMIGAAEEYVSGDGTDISFTVGSGGDINIGSDIGLTFGDDGEKIEGDGTDLTISSSALANIDAGTDIVLDADGGDIFFKDDGTTFGSATNTSGNLIIKSGTTTALTFSGANATFAGTLATAAGGLNIAGLDIDGGTDVGAALVDADLIIVDDGAGGTNRKATLSRLMTYVNANSTGIGMGKAIAAALVFG
jgi:hypothetical protein